MGRVKNQDVIGFIQSRRPELIKEGKIFLGQIENNQELEWDQKDVKNLISNFITYSFLRNEFRQLRRSV